LQGRPVGVVGLAVAHQQGELERVLEVDRRQLGRRGADEREVAGIEGSTEVGVGRALDRHEHMFA
jgi:hypothetical protein